MEVRIVYYGMFEGPGFCENWIADALNRNGHYCYRVEKTQISWHDFKEWILRYKPEAILFTKIPEVSLDEFAYFRKGFGGKIIFWTFDYMRDPSNEWYWKMAPLADICFQTDGMDHTGWYKENKVNRVELHQAAAPQHDLPRNVTKKDVEKWDYDVVFMGSLYTERRRRLDRELSSLGVNYKHFGFPGYELWGSDFARACYFSKIVIGDNYTNKIPGYWSDRSYLTLGCGGFLITSFVPFLEKTFANKRHLVWYRSMGELKELITYYLERENERKFIALEGYRYVQKFHTYDRRMEVFNGHLKKL